MLASKAALIHLSRMMGAEIAKNGLEIRVNSIAPGVFPSEMTAGESDENQKNEIPKEKFEGKVPARRPGNDRDMGNGVRESDTFRKRFELTVHQILFVASNQYLNGQAIAIDGGYVLATGT